MVEKGEGEGEWNGAAGKGHGVTKNTRGTQTRNVAALPASLGQTPTFNDTPPRMHRPSRDGQPAGRWMDRMEIVFGDFTPRYLRLLSDAGTRRSSRRVEIARPGRPVNNIHDPYTSAASNCKRDLAARKPMHRHKFAYTSHAVRRRHRCVCTGREGEGGTGYPFSRGGVSRSRRCCRAHAEIIINARRKRRETFKPINDVDLSSVDRRERCSSLSSLCPSTPIILVAVAV